MILWALRLVVKWLVISGVLVSAYVNRDALVAHLDGARPPAAGAVETGQAAAAGGQSVRLKAERGGHFFVTARVDGVPVRFMVDTGATVVALTGADARRVGLTANDRERAETHWTANGSVRVAPVRLKEVAVGSIVIRDVDAVVNERMDGISLLGMSYLRRLAGFSVQGDELLLSR